MEMELVQEFPALPLGLELELAPAPAPPAPLLGDAGLLSWADMMENDRLVVLGCESGTARRKVPK